MLKWAKTADGFMDKIRNKNSENTPNWISNQFSQQWVHKMRTEEQSILIGTTTALNDNPKLSARAWVGKNPIRIVLDRSLRIPKSFKLYDLSQKTIFITGNKEITSSDENLIFETIDFERNVPEQICELLFEYGIQSLIVEGGVKTIQSFIDVKLWDTAFVFTGGTLFGNGLVAPELKSLPIQSEGIQGDVLNIYRNNEIRSL